MNPAPAHLEARLRFWDFTIGQIGASIIGVLIGFVWVSHLSPIGGLGAAIVGVYIAGVPVAAAFVASQTEFDLWGLLATMLRWRRLEGRYIPGAGTRPHGYMLTGERDDPGNGKPAVSLDRLSPWGER